MRNYFAKNTPFSQLNALDALAEALGCSHAGGGGGSGNPAPPFLVTGGYVSAPRGAAGLGELDAALAHGAPSRDAARGCVRVGLQADTAVTFAGREPWVRAPAPAPRVTQVYAAALSLGGYKDPRTVSDDAWAPLATLVLEAAYEAALWAAVASAGGGAPLSFLLA